MTQSIGRLDGVRFDDGCSCNDMSALCPAETDLGLGDKSGVHSLGQAKDSMGSF